MLKLLLCCAALAGGAAEVEAKKEVAICAIFQDEAPYLHEWAQYHLSMGVDHIFLYNNESSDEYFSEIAPWLQTHITLVQWPNLWPAETFPMGCQSYAYSHCLYTYGENFYWMGFIDIDEYVVPLRDGNIKKLLHRYRKKDCIALQWLCFGTSGVYQCPKGKMLKTLIYRAPLDHSLNGYFKSFVKCDKVFDCTNPHFCNMIDGAEPYILKRKTCRLNHYWSKDQNFVESTKIPRYFKWGVQASAVQKLVDSLSAEKDTEIFRFISN